AWNAGEKEQIQIRRRFMLLGQTLAGMQTWDIRRALQAIRAPANPSTQAGAKIDVHAGAAMSVPALYATLFEAPPASLTLFDPPSTHADGPDLLNVLRFIDIPQAAAMVAERGIDINLMAINIQSRAADRWRYPAAVIERLKWPNAAITFGAKHPPRR
ncbi:MAG TPA: hypothetical protein VG125_25880, partial [Pirellulales bacterium]|nr:hypothetical protein [Pirellulales bacterium]